MGAEWVGTAVAAFAIAAVGAGIVGGRKAWRSWRDSKKRRQAAVDRFDPVTDDGVREHWDEHSRD